MVYDRDYLKRLSSSLYLDKLLLLEDRLYFLGGKMPPAYRNNFTIYELIEDNFVENKKIEGYAFTDFELYGSGTGGLLVGINQESDLKKTKLFEIDQDINILREKEFNFLIYKLDLGEDDNSGIAIGDLESGYTDNVICFFDYNNFNFELLLTYSYPITSEYYEDIDFFYPPTGLSGKTKEVFFMGTHYLYTVQQMKENLYIDYFFFHYKNRSVEKIYTTDRIDYFLTFELLSYSNSTVTKIYPFTDRIAFNSLTISDYTKKVYAVDQDKRLFLINKDGSYTNMNLNISVDRIDWNPFGPQAVIISNKCFYLFKNGSIDFLYEYYINTSNNEDWNVKIDWYSEIYGLINITHLYNISLINWTWNETVVFLLLNEDKIENIDANHFILYSKPVDRIIIDGTKISVNNISFDCRSYLMEHGINPDYYKLKTAGKLFKNGCGFIQINSYGHRYLFNNYLMEFDENGPVNLFNKKNLGLDDVNFQKIVELDNGDSRLIIHPYGISKLWDNGKRRHCFFIYDNLVINGDENILILSNGEIMILADSDLDGYNDEIELLWNSDPSDPVSKPPDKNRDGIPEN
jgi:hypothetical protein